MIARLAVALALCCCAAFAAAQEKTVYPAVEHWIKDHAAKSKGTEHRNSRRVATGDLDGDGRTDVAVLYTLERRGSPDYSLTYLAVFVGGAQGLKYEAHALVGGKGIRQVSKMSVLERMLMLDALEYQPSDELCCPSRMVLWRYRLEDHKLVDAKSAPAAKPKPGASARPPEK